jgi:penicillin-binding protein 1A
VISPQVAIDMIRMMNSVVENGTGKRAALAGIPTAGKTGTTNDWRDGWFVGYTGNFVGAVWMGNDDFSPTKHMTGGTLPAMTWHDIMAYAHQGVELRQLPGMAVPEHVQVAAEGSYKGTDTPHPAMLTRKANEALVHVEQMLDEADHALAAQPPATLGALDGSGTSNGGNGRANTLAAAADQKSSPAPRGD